MIRPQDLEQPRRRKPADVTGDSPDDLGALLSQNYDALARKPGGMDGIPRQINFPGDGQSLGALPMGSGGLIAESQPMDGPSAPTGDPMSRMFPPVPPQRGAPIGDPMDQMMPPPPPMRGAGGAAGGGTGPAPMGRDGIPRDVNPPGMPSTLGVAPPPPPPLEGMGAGGSAPIDGAPGGMPPPNKGGMPAPGQPPMSGIPPMATLPPMPMPGGPTPPGGVPGPLFGPGGLAGAMSRQTPQQNSSASRRNQLARMLSRYRGTPKR